MVIKKPKKEHIKTISKTVTLKEEKPFEKYFEGIGRRKTAIARVRVWLNAKKREITVNEKDFADYFRMEELRNILIQPFEKSGISDFSAQGGPASGWKVSVKVSGGGLQAQAHAARHGLSRALILARPELKTMLKTIGFLTRDSRMKERKKPGLKGARRAPQWSKR